ncbi:hypothetical protein [Sphingomonas sp. GB1N7]|uniref:hypothetical protein n=1 Tax=Parasphingomonas caseinilytica TaxID=3096158 RepID=UPI002FC66231
MSSISSLSSFTPQSSPRTQMNERISKAVSAGLISATDQTALSSALDSIDSSLSASRDSGTQKSGSFKEKIGSMIDEQVSSGTLTEAQATELKGFFAEGGPKGAGGMKGHRGPPPGAEESTGSTSSTDTASTQLDALMKMLENLRNSQDSKDSYSATGTSSTTSSSQSGLLISTLA